MRAWALVSLLLVAPGRGAADLEAVDSLAWLVADADVVVGGVVEESRPFAPDGWFTRVRVRAMLRGSGAPDVLFRGGGPLEVGARVIAFGRTAAGWGFTPTLYLGEGAVALARDGAPIAGLDAIAAAAREVPPGRARGVWVALPDGRSLRVPADVETQARARAMVASDDFVTRAMGARLLWTFESSRNVALLRGLLADRATFPGSDVRVVCIHARDVLAHWDVPVPDDACAAGP